MERKFRLVNDDHVYTFEEIAEKITNGGLLKSAYIWEPSLTDWVKLKDYPDFAQIFAVYEAQAEESMKKALGTDDEAMERKQTRQLLSDVSKEEQKLAFQQRPVVRWTITALACIAMLGSTVKVLYTLFQTKEGQELLGTVVEEMPAETIDLERVRMASGVTRLDEVKGIEVKKVEKSREKELLAEILADIRKEEAQEQAQQQAPATAAGQAAAKQEPPKKRAGLFDKVSDEEIEQFRRSLLAKKTVGPQKEIGKTGAAEKPVEIQEELSSKQISKVVKENSNSTIAYCYNRSLKLDASLSGKLEVTVSVLGSGRVAKVETNTQKFRGTNLEQCVKEMIKKKWTFPQFNGTITEVTIPFLLSSE
ncbi:MAG TPA: AgmX/PglI C-terminal domain-containing protein [bacterium]|nr:AgmX/PglI C-terminal domain-containing protein [bacterium]